MNKRRCLFTVSFVSIFVLGAASSFYLMKRCITSPAATTGDFDSFHAWAHSLGLSPSQEAKIKPMEKDLQKDLQTIQKHLSEERMELCRLMYEKTSTLIEIDNRLEKIGDLEKAQQKRVVNHLMMMKSVMTPDQEEHFFQVMMKRLCPHCRSHGSQDHDSCSWCSLKK